MLVLNGDILTGVDFARCSPFTANKAELTVAVRHVTIFQVPYGVVGATGVGWARVNEKPSYNFFVNAGIYLLEPARLPQYSGGRAVRHDRPD